MGFPYFIFISRQRTNFLMSSVGVLVKVLLYLIDIVYQGLHIYIFKYKRTSGSIYDKMSCILN